MHRLGLPPSPKVAATPTSRYRNVATVVVAAAVAVVAAAAVATCCWFLVLLHIDVACCFLVKAS